MTTNEVKHKKTKQLLKLLRYWREDEDETQQTETWKILDKALKEKYKDK